MLGIKSQWKPWRAVVSFLMAAVLVSSLVACGDRAPKEPPTSTSSEASKTVAAGPVSEVSPPEAIQQLRSFSDIYKPQVTIISPQTDEVVQDTTVEARFQVQDLPIFKDPDLGLGLHLNVILDNQPAQAVYDLNQPLAFKDLPPGTHTLRVFASRPWDESFKNEGAYAQTTFHIFTKTPNNNPEPTLPLLTYNSPTGSYGAEPIILDFYLTNAPLHLAARENPEDEIADWRIRVTVNGQSFVLDRWQPIYLKGFKPGKNWVQLEYIDEKGNPVNNVFNNTARLISYDPKGKDTLSALVRNEIPGDRARKIADPNYTPAPTPEESPAPEAKQTPQPSPTPEETKKSEKPKPGGFFNRFRRRNEPSGAIAPSTPIPPPSVEVPPPLETPEPEAEKIPLPVPSPSVKVPPPLETPEPEASPTARKEVEPTSAETKQLEKPKPGGFFNRFRRRNEPSGAIAPSTPIPPPSVEVPPPLEAPEPEAEKVPLPLPSPSVKVPPPLETLEPEAEKVPLLETPEPEASPTPRKEVEPTSAETKQSEKPKPGGFFNRFRRRSTEGVPAPSPSLSPVIETPTPSIEVPPQLQEPEPEALSTRLETTPGETKQSEKPKSIEVFDRLTPFPSVPPTLPPTLPEIIATPTPTPAVSEEKEAEEKSSSVPSAIEALP